MSNATKIDLPSGCFVNFFCLPIEDILELLQNYFDKKYAAGTDALLSMTVEELPKPNILITNRTGALEMSRYIDMEIIEVSERYSKTDPFFHEKTELVKILQLACDFQVGRFFIFENALYLEIMENYSADEEKALHRAEALCNMGLHSKANTY